jgi:NADPH-dependent F420 reductase
VPWDGHGELLAGLREELAGQSVVVDCVNPLGFDKRGCFALAGREGSAARAGRGAAARQPRRRRLPPRQRRLLEDPEVTDVGTDVMVLGDDREATDLVAALAGLVPGMRGIYAGRLRNAGQVEALTANLISVNRRYKAHAGCGSPTCEAAPHPWAPCGRKPESLHSYRTAPSPQTRFSDYFSGQPHQASDQGAEGSIP